MPFSDSMFLFEIVVEELTSFTDCKKFHIKSKFAEVFKLTLKDPNISDSLVPTTRRLKKKIKVRDENGSEQKPPVEGKLQSGQSVLFTSPITTLINTMKNYPIEITLYNKEDHKKRLGSVHIPWSPLYIDYLYSLATKNDPAPIVISGGHNVYDDTTSRRMATMLLKIKLTHLRDKITPYGHSLAVTHQDIKFHSHTTLYSKSDVLSARSIIDDPGTIKTVYSGGKRKKKASNKSKARKNKKVIEFNEDPISEDSIIKNTTETNLINDENNSCVVAMQKEKEKLNMLHLVKSVNDLRKEMQDDVVRTKSCSFINKKHLNFLNYVFGCTDKPLDKRVFCVGYFTVENEYKESSSKGSSRSPAESQAISKDGTTDCECKDGTKPYRFCDEDCSKQRSDETCLIRACQEDANKLNISQCNKVRCNILEKRKLPLPTNDTIHLDLTSLKKERMEKLGEAVQQVVGGVKAQMKVDENKCYCECECTFGFVKRTTYCAVCGGYEAPGEDLSTKILTGPFPCPIYHKLKPKSTSGSDRSRMCDGPPKKPKPPPPPPPQAKVESDKEYCRKKKKEKDDDRFKFNYGYTGIPPQIGHSGCAAPCTGALNAVPKNMGWLWTADDVPGMKFRPSWKPGCVHKHVLHLLRMAKDPGIVLAKKKKKPEKKKKPLKRPLLTVAKKDGEYTVTMETMKAYSKPRALNQQPYEDKPVLTYTIGRTEEENRERQKRKERVQRRLERDQRDFIQSAFADMCKEICLKTYRQALGFLPNTETPECFCYPNQAGPDDTNLEHSCSCSEDEVSFGSDTDSDEWLVEFTPPNAHFDPTYKGKQVKKQDTGTQYTYLDYRVKLLDRSGNQVVRLFKGPDGKTQCSDLGGFWGPNHQWLEINIDGFIAPDDKWAPMTFIGPQGDNVDCETGKFQDIDGTWLTVGVDGYVDASGRWKYYNRSKNVPPRKHTVKKGFGDTKDNKVTAYKSSDTNWSCFGDANPKELSELGILGHGQDKKLLLQRLTEMLQHGEDVKIPEPSMIPRVPGSRKGKRKGADTIEFSFYSDRSKCKHAMPSSKGIVAVDDRGHKTYFRVKEYDNKRPKERLANLVHQGISTSSFHVPCLSSFINAEMLRKQQYERFLKNKSPKFEDMEYGTSSNSRDATTQAQYRYRYAI